MRAVVFILATCALLPAASAGAGQCTTEIDNLAKQLAARDAGSGPTAGAAAIGQHPPTSANTDKSQHPPTAIMNREATGSGEITGIGQPSTGSAPASGGAETKEQPTPSAAMNRGAAEHTAPTDGMKSVSMELERARIFDQHGKDEECLRVIDEAKQLMAR